MPKYELSNYDRLTGVYLCTNVDGVHVKEKCIGYIDQHPFVVLTQLFPNYYIYGYKNSELYPAYLAGFKSFLYIKDEGYTNSYLNYTKHKVKNIESFVYMFRVELSSAECNDKYNEEYLPIIDKCIGNNADLQLAIDILANEADLSDEEDIRIRLYRTYELYKAMYNNKPMRLTKKEYARGPIEMGDL